MTNQIIVVSKARKYIEVIRAILRYKEVSYGNKR